MERAMSDVVLGARVTRDVSTFSRPFFVALGSVVIVTMGAVALGLVVAAVVILSISSVKQAPAPEAARINERLVTTEAARASERLVTTDLSCLCEREMEEAFVSAGSSITGVDRRDHRSDKIVLINAGLPRAIAARWKQSSGDVEPYENVLQRDACPPKDLALKSDRQKVKRSRGYFNPRARVWWSGP
jgi:hypothetical protein